MKNYLEYDQATGQITDETGLLIYTYLGAKPMELETSSEELETSPEGSVDKLNMVDSLIKLKNSGFTADDVIAIAKANLINGGTS